MKSFSILTFFVLSFLSASCDDFFNMVVDLEIEADEPKLAITSFISDNSETSRVLVSYSVSGTQQATDNQLINNANVILSSNTESYTLSYTGEEGIYKVDSSIDLTPDTAYTLQVEATGYETVNATQFFPKEVAILNAKIESNTLNFRFQDPPDQINYYFIELQVFDTESHVEARLFNREEEETSGFFQSTSHGHGIIFNDETFEGTDVELNFKCGIYTGSDTTIPFQIKAILYTITEDMYKYNRSLALFFNTEDSPFVEPLPIYKNIENGYGIFGMMNASEYILDYSEKNKMIR